MLFSAGALAAPEPTPHETSASNSFERIDALIASDAWQLALRAIDEFPAISDRGLAEDLERRRVRIYRQLSDAAALAARIERLPPETSAAFRQWALEQLADTAVAAQDFARAREAFEKLAANGDDSAARRWRARLVRLYLDAGQGAEALVAFAPLTEVEDARMLHAEALLHVGQDREAFERVAGLTAPEARLWRLIAAHRLSIYAPADTVHELSLLVRELRDRPMLQRLAWVVRAEAARQTGQHARRVNSLEQVFRLEDVPSSPLAKALPDDLWSAYLALGRHIAQAEELTLGSDALKRADAYSEQDPYSARALYAWNAVDAKDPEVRATAHERLVADLAARGLTAVIRSLYTDSRRFVSGEVPPAVGYVLMREALKRRDLPAAAQYAGQLETPPEGEAPIDWDLRRARMLLYGGETDAAVKVLRALVAGDAFDIEVAPRFLQVVFDLQALGKHRDALTLLESVEARVDNARMHRELLYWKAESTAALARHADAAELFLQSAHAGESAGSDPWGHSARFRAAESLVSAGLSRDAESIYRGLLKETSDPNRRLLIEQKIEHLWLATPPVTKP